MDQIEKGEAFRALHETGTFIIPNPWDVGSAVMLQNLGFKAIATTSAGFAYAQGMTDGQPTLDDKLVHCAALAGATDIPLAVDFEDGYATNPEDVAANILKLAETGVVGASVEDWSRTEGKLHDVTGAAERVAAAAEAAASLPFPFVLTARAENLIRGVDDLDDTIARLKQYEAAGADVLYAPGLRSLDMVDAVLAEVSKPVNVLVPFLAGEPLSAFESRGVRRLSLGNALGNHALHAMLGAVDEMQSGGFTWFAESAASGGRIHKLLR